MQIDQFIHESEHANAMHVNVHKHINPKKKKKKSQKLITHNETPLTTKKPLET